MERFNFDSIVTDLARKNLLYKVVGRFADTDLHPDTISNLEMGYLYEELIRKFSELSNETAGEHFTPREVIRLMVNLLITEDDDILTKPGRIATVYDPAAGTGGMLSVAEAHIREHNSGANVALFGQELNDETFAVAKSDMMVKGQDASRIVPGNSFTDDGHPKETFDYILANPPFGVDWGKYAEPIIEEHKTKGFDGRFGPGLPRKSDGSMLFLLHMISKMKPASKGGSRIAIIFNASPLFTGSPGGGESEIRRWIIENDWLETIVAMPEQLFYNTGIATYVWVVTNNKSDERKGLVQLIDAREMWTPMKKSLGDKRRMFSEEQIAEITRIHQDFTDADDKVSKVFPNHHFGFQRITVDRPMEDRSVDKNGQPAADSALRDTETVPLPEENYPWVSDPKDRLADEAHRDTVEAYMKEEVLPWVPDAWVDHGKTKIGYEIPFTREFYVYEPPRSLEEIDADIEGIESEILALLEEIRR